MIVAGVSRRDPLRYAPVFVLAPARSNSSVVTAMLGQHPELCAFPELALFRKETVGDLLTDPPGWTGAPAAQRMAGVYRALAEHHDQRQTSDTVSAAADWVESRSGWDVAELLDYLLALAALAEGAREVIVAVGGSATTDGGLGAVQALGGEPFRVPVRVACDVQTLFVDAAVVFAPQKGATSAQVDVLTQRLAELAERYGAEVSGLPGSGAAGGLAGGLASLGAELVPGFELVAAHVGLGAALDGAALVLTGEGRLDSTSFDGKVVGGVLDACTRRGIAAVVIAGDIQPGLLAPVPAYSLVERFGPDRAYAEPEACVAELAAEATGRPTRSAR